MSTAPRRTLDNNYTNKTRRHNREAVEARMARPWSHTDEFGASAVLPDKQQLHPAALSGNKLSNHVVVALLGIISCSYHFYTRVSQSLRRPKVHPCRLSKLNPHKRINTQRFMVGKSLLSFSTSRAYNSATLYLTWSRAFTAAFACVSSSVSTIPFIVHTFWVWLSRHLFKTKIFFALHLHVGSGGSSSRQKSALN